MEVSELADEGEQGPKYYAKTSNLNVQPSQKNYGGSFVRGPVRFSPDVPLKLHGYGESLANYFFRRRCPFPRKRIWNNPLASSFCDSVAFWPLQCRACNLKHLCVLCVLVDKIPSHSLVPLSCILEPRSPI